MVKIPPAPHSHVKPPEFEWNDYMITCNFSSSGELIIHFQALLRECLEQGYKAAIESGGPSYERTFSCYPVPLQFKPIFQERLEELIFGGAK